MLLKKKFILCVVSVLLLIFSVGCDKSDASDIKSVLASSVISSKVSDIKNQKTDDKQQPDNNIEPDIPDNSQNEEQPDNSVPDDRKPIKDTENLVKQPDQKNENDMNNQNSNDKNNSSQSNKNDNQFVPPVREERDYTKYERSDAKLLVNGKDITGDHYVKILSGSNWIEAEIPFLTVMEELGADIEQLTERFVKITTHQIRLKSSTMDITVYNENEIYILDIQTGFIGYGKRETKNNKTIFVEDYVYDESFFKDFIDGQKNNNLFNLIVGGDYYRCVKVINGEFITDLSSPFPILTHIADFFKINDENNTISIGCYEE